MPEAIPACPHFAWRRSRRRGSPVQSEEGTAPPIAMDLTAIGPGFEFADIRGGFPPGDEILASLDLVVTNYVPAVWLELTNSVPAEVRVPQPSPYRRKHV